MVTFIYNAISYVYKQSKDVESTLQLYFNTYL
jgi:hypothetical protein